MSTSTATQILETLGPSCRDSGRREALLKQNVLNGIDFMEFEEQTVAGPPAAMKYLLHVRFLGDLPPGEYGLTSDASPILVHGGTRITGIKVLHATRASARTLDVEVDAQGDFSPYLLSIGWKREGGIWQYRFDSIDRLFSVGPINFRPGCPVDFDCGPTGECPPDVLPEPALDYLARDYASFRQLLIDLVAQRNPAWLERSPADQGMALLELFAHEGDHANYLLDAVANEGSLDTARQRVSAKRHAKLVDYQMHDGRNAWTYVHVEVEKNGAGEILAGTQLVTEITSPMRFDRQPGVVPIPQPASAPDPKVPTTRLNFVSDQDYRTDPALAQVRVFETTTSATVDALNNELRIHTWGNADCCLQRGATTAHLYAIDPSGTRAVRPPLKVGDFLLFEEVISPGSGSPADADPTHRQVVQIEQVNPDPSTSTGPETDGQRDRLFLYDIDAATKEPREVGAVTVATAATLPLVEVRWRKADALTFPLCLSKRVTPSEILRRVSVARGNLLLADQGRTVTTLDDDGNVTRQSFDFSPELKGETTFRLTLPDGPLTVQCQPDREDESIGFPPIRQRTDLSCDVHEPHAGATLMPAVALRTYTQGPTPTTWVEAGDWLPVSDLLESDEFAKRFVTDIDDLGRGVLRFGDGVYGQTLTGVERIEVWYRVGNGRAGNIGADSLAHVVEPYPRPGNWPPIAHIRNPLPAEDGTDPETIEEVRQYAPAAFRANQLRAVTEEDYRERALTISGVAGAVASFRWTGSWYTVFVGIDPADEADVLTDAYGVARLEPAFEQKVRDTLARFRLAGYDLEVRAARYVPLEIVIEICAKPGYFRGDVAEGVVEALVARPSRRGVRGFFDPAKFTFGQSVYLSRIYAAVENVDGVESARITTFRRRGRDAAGELESGSLTIGPWEIARLDNDPNNMENGTLTITAGGGS